MGSGPQVETQSRLQALLAQEHKLLESVFPRHVIEGLTMSTIGHAHGSSPGPAPLPGPSPGNQHLLNTIGTTAATPMSTMHVGTMSLMNTQQSLNSSATDLMAATKAASMATLHPCVTILFADCVGAWVVGSMVGWAGG